MLSSWNDTAPKKAIIDFVERITKEGNDAFVPAPERMLFLITTEHGGLNILQ